MEDDVMARAEYSQDRSVAMVLYRNQSAVARLPPVGVLWRWSDAVDAVGTGVLQRLERAGLVQRVHGVWWSATEELAGHLRKNHSVELDGSPGVGQRVLDVSGRPILGASRSERSDPTVARVTSGRQVTLGGNDADTRSLGEPDIPPWNAKRTQNPADYDGQMRLNEISEWLPAG